jgi:Na+-translocating ferredoxin:NAD+ oxidoreductase subunit G
MMTNKDIAKIALNLIVVYVIGGVLLAGVYVYTSPIMYRNAIAAKQAALKKIMPEANSIEKSGDWTIHEHHAEYYTAKKGNDLCGYIVESYGKGYSSFIHVLIATDTAYAVKKIDILSHGETPGLGDEIEAAWFKKQFAGKSALRMKVIKGATTDNIQAISGATISSRAVTEDAVRNALEFLSQAKQGAVAHGEN